MKGIMIVNKRIFSLLMVLVFLMLPVSSAYATTNKPRIPDSFAVDGVLPDGTSIFNSINDDSRIITPYVLLGKEYAGNLSASFSEFIYTYAYLYGTTVQFSKGASPSYRLNTTETVTKSTSWSIGGSFGTNDKAKIQADISASYGRTKTATIERGEEWSCGFTEPGTYNLTWYMRGHKYNLYADLRWIDTGVNDGKITNEYIGDIYLPTTEITLNVRKVY